MCQLRYDMTFTFLFLGQTYFRYFCDCILNKMNIGKHSSSAQGTQATPCDMWPTRPD